MVRLVAGIDLGATNMRVGLVTAEGKVVASTRLDTRAQEGAERAMARLGEAIDGLLKAVAGGVAGGRAGGCSADGDTAGCELVGVGLGMPGPLRPVDGVAVAPPNMPAWHGARVADMLSTAIGVPVFLTRDSHAALLGEWWRGAASGCSYAAMLTLGTGVGGSAIVGGRIWPGRDGFSWEFGHMTVDVNGPVCGCGNRGCLEAIASGSGIARRTGRQGVEVFRAAREGEPEALRIVAEVAAALGAGLANVVNIINPEVIVIGGGMLVSRDLFWDTMIAEMRRRAFPPACDGLRVMPAVLGEEAGIIGAARLALDALGEPHS